jgi:murein DD-endopeptidase MepM/ murein hydrolase activator NlpD
MLPPGVYPLHIEAKLDDGTTQSFEQNVLVNNAYYPEDVTLYVESEMIDPSVTEPEMQQLIALTTEATPVRMWDGIFTSPAVYQEYTSTFGLRRTYKSLDGTLTLDSFHSGLDFAGGEGLAIFAPAAGKVIFAGPLTVRGNATVIDHGWGVYSGFWHQSVLEVNVGDMVTAGQEIGKVGGTGRVTGPHQHWEIWVNGIQVDPMDWLNQVFP